MEKEQLVSLVTAVQQGDAEAATNLYNAFHQDLYYHIYKTTNDATLAEDLLQDTFMEIFQTIDRLNEPAAFVTWSKQIAYHRCTAYFRKRREILADEDEDGYSVFDTVEEDRSEFIPGEDLDKEEFQQTIHAMIAQLPPEQRSALLMRYFDEISVKEIAQIQGVTENTVKSRLNYGRKAIKQAVEDYEKKHDIKLHSVAIIPLLLWLFREYAKANGISLTSSSASAAYTAATAATTGSATAASANAAAAAATAGAKAAGKLAAAKLMAGILAAAVVVGGVAVGLSLNKEKDPTPQGIPSSTQSQLPGQTQTQPATTTVPTTTVPTTTVPTTTVPAVPTEEELQTLDNYKYIVSSLYSGHHSSQQLKDWFNQLQAMDLTVIDKWRGTEYASDDIQWDYNTVFSDFLIHEDVLLGYKETKTDALDNSTSWEYLDLVYDINGFAIHDFFAPFHATESMNVHKNTYHFSYSIVDGQLSFYENDPLYQVDDYMFPNTPVYSVREDGTVEKVTWSYNGEVRAVYRPEYDAEGKLIRMEITDQEYDYTVDYVYDDLGHLTEICTNNLNHPDYFAPWITYEYDENGRLANSIVYNKCKKLVESTDFPGANASFNLTAAFYLYGDNGQLSQIQLQSLFYTTTGDKTTCYAIENLIPHYDESGRLSSLDRESGRNTYTYDLIYGDYYLFTPVEN